MLVLGLQDTTTPGSSAPSGRQSCFLMWAVRRELLRLDGECPARDPALLSWLASRRASEGAEDEATGHGDASTSSTAPWSWASLFFVLMYVDDVGAVSLGGGLLLGGGVGGRRSSLREVDGRAGRCEGGTPWAERRRSGSQGSRALSIYSPIQ